MTMQPAEYPIETVFQAQDLYCVDRLTYDAVSARLGVSVPTLKRWGDKYGWREKREELAEAESQIKFNLTKARAKMLAKVVKDGGAQDAFAVAALENLIIKQQEVAAQLNPPKSDYTAVKIESEAMAAELLEEALSRKLGAILAEPESLSLKMLKEFKDALALAREMRGRADEAVASSKTLTPETEARIKDILAGGF